MVRFCVALVMLTFFLGGGPVWAAGWPSELPRVLNKNDEAVYRILFTQANDGRQPMEERVSQLSDKSLMPHVMAQYYLRSDVRIAYEELADWLNKNPDFPQAEDLYQLALVRRPPAPQTCETVTKTIKVKDKKTKKMVSKKKQERVCKAAGERLPLPRKPLAMIAREQRKDRLEAAREAEYARLPASVAEARRQLAGELWRLRSKGDFEEAYLALNRVDARDVLGDARWQDELVKVAEWHYTKKDYPKARRAALQAGSVREILRDKALWIAGMASYRMDDLNAAASSWQTLAREEPVKGNYYARAAWWGARTFKQLGDKRAAKKLLHMAAQDPLSFYGQVAAAELGYTPDIDFDTPDIGRVDIDSLVRIDEVRRALALAMVGEGGLAQEEIRAGYDKIPYQATRTLVAIGLRLHMPGMALRVAKDLQKKGDVVPAALYPQPDEWHPRGPVVIDRALMLAIMRQESAFQPAIGSHAGAQGLMQLMPATARYIARIANRPAPSLSDLHDPEVNLTLAQDYLDYLNEKLDGNLILVVAAYNGGVGNVTRWLSRGVAPADDPMMFIESIPFSETKDYVEKVMVNLWIYQQQMGVRPRSREALAEGYWPLKFANRYDRTDKAM